ncbi:SIMPL domain-containing protein [Methylibium sp.]|uniref:SIMPL domain-containing protein n=1 Tax=Methylibium sp. TaxID=2067992 RepID=UPI00182F33B4|nr:SIMPL domain-containing protein [Methylibium sp.]MBA3588554.1 SIMPL domain-containing protein [Methylibium sp.]
MDFLRFPALALLAATAAVCGAAAAAEATPREHLLNFSASARLEVEQDLLGITLAVTREGSNAAAVQAQLKQVLDAALSETRPSAKAGAMEVRTGNFSLYPRHDKNGRIDGWQGRAELVLEGKDTERVAAAAVRLAGMNVTSVGYSLSPELTDKHEASVTAEAIRQYRARATELARQFGYSGYTLGEVSVHSSQQDGNPRPVMYRAQKADMAMAEAPVPTEPGKGVISATVSGSVRLTN